MQQFDLLLLSLLIQQTLVYRMHADFNRQARLTVQDLNKLCTLSQSPKTLKRESSFYLKFSTKRSTFYDTKSQQKKISIRKHNKIKITSSKVIKNQKQNSQHRYKQTMMMLPLPNQTFLSNSQDYEENSSEKHETYSSVKLNKALFHRIEKNISQRYQKKIQVLKQLKIPRITNQLITISKFTYEALNSIPKHVQTFNQKLKLLKKSMTPTFQIDRYQRKKYSQLNRMPTQLKTLRVSRKDDSNQKVVLSSRLTQNKFRMHLVRKNKKNEENPEAFDIEGWQAEKNQRQRILFD